MKFNYFLFISTVNINHGLSCRPRHIAHQLKEGNQLCNATEISVEMNVYVIWSKWIENPIYTHRMYMVYRLSDNSIVENRLID